jgi:hypothetical protein
VEHHKNIIYTTIRKSDLGTSQEEIVRKSHLTRQTVSAHVNDLVQEGRIYYVIDSKDKRKRLYFAHNQDISNVHLFSRVMNEAGITIIDSALINPSKEDTHLFSKPDNIPYYEFCKKVSGITVSDNFCKTNFNKTHLYEKYLFEFVNRLGAFIAYIFIESMRPTHKSTLDQTKRNELGSILLEKSINIKEIFDRFVLLFGQMGLIRREENDESFIELDRRRFTKLVDVFRSLYPKIYEGFEKYWSTSRQYHLVLSTRLAKGQDCNHKWEETYLYNYEKKCYLCRKCHFLASYEVDGSKGVIKRKKQSQGEIENEKEIMNNYMKQKRQRTTKT